MRLKWVIVSLVVQFGFFAVKVISYDPAGYGLMTPLLPVAAISGHAGLLTLGLTGAALLKLKTAGLITHWLIKRKKHRARKGWHGRPRGKGRPKGGWHRKEDLTTLSGDQVDRYDQLSTTYNVGKVKIDVKPLLSSDRERRSVPAETSHFRIPVIEYNTKDTDNNYEPTLDEVLQYDQIGCGMRLVCELSAISNEKLMEDEKRILEVFSKDKQQGIGLRASRGKLSYNYAALLGSHSKDNKICSNVYGRCPYSAEQIMHTLRDPSS